MGNAEYRQTNKRKVKRKLMDMKNEEKAKKGFFGMMMESFNKTGGCCGGPGDTCCGPGEESDKAQSRESEKSKEDSKAGQKQG